MYSEPNHHSRNLKLISLMFVLYWLLALSPADDSIRLSIINYKVQNPKALLWAAHAALVYFAWRFYLSSKNRIRHGFINHLAIGNFSNQTSSIFKTLKKKAEADYVVHHREAFQQERENYAQKHQIESYNRECLSVIPLGFGYEGNQLRLEYQVQYDRGQHGDLYFRNYKIFYEQYRWLRFKSWRLVRFILEKEDGPDYVIPWVLFILAVTTSALSHFDITALNIFE
ncbi:hypothetical protein [Pseudomonas sp. NMI760_13]|uniref:hypothetical protein n=1 Tax=Pseudomonas sp. NMI760_13 TaxID=2903147 RepID=UPI001E5CC083|nr:hypothetical protein [Pseudomonas sp. NMI760_13]MCE0915641.1 hypothetical protein [Pseudomonas sp. NMI760_13]